MRLIDSHCHLNYAGLVERQDEVLARARAAGVTTMLNIATRASEWGDVTATAEREPDVWATVGIHPHEADAHPEVDAARLVAAAEHPRIVGIGETGLDYHYDHSDRDRQQASFRAHIATARETGLPLIVHTRDAEDDTAAILAAEMARGAYPGVIHCFTASAEFARKALELGLFISISGIVTFKNAKDLQATAAALPAERLLIETDAPFLAPVPHRGRPGEPAFVADTARFLADLRGEEPERLAAATSDNFLRLFGKVAGVRAVLLGCGTSSGVPRIGNDWGACDPADPRNRRRRASILVESATTRILVDTSPDLREQLLAAQVDAVDAVIWTHDHADHCHGIDDLRQLYHARGAPVAGYARPATLASLARRFGYVFDGRDGYPATATAHPLGDDMAVGDIRIRTVDQPHGSITSAGLRFECGGAAIGYATDFHALTDAMASLYAGLDLWIIDALRRKPHPTHPHLAQTLGWIERLRPARAVLTHMDQTMDYAALAAALPPGVTPGHDGLTVALA